MEKKSTGKRYQILTSLFSLFLCAFSPAFGPICSILFSKEPSLEQYLAASVNIDAETFYAPNEDEMEDY